MKIRRIATLLVLAFPALAMTGTPPAMPAWSDGGPSDGFKLGVSAAAAGDLNNDGFGDIIVGADNAARIYLGGPGGLMTLGWSAQGQSPDDMFGVSVASGDIDGDGNPDVVVGAPAQGHEGAVHFYYGTGAGLPASADVILPGHPGGGFFGWKVALSDVTGDGRAEILVNGGIGGSPQSLVIPADASGHPDPVTAHWQIYTASTGIQPLGDVNGDGVGDFAVISGNGNRIVLGGAVPFKEIPIVGGDETTVHAVGDLNNDGLADFATCGPNFDSFRVVEVYHGMAAADPEWTVAAWSVERYWPEYDVPIPLAGLGDFDGDGFGDLGIMLDDPRMIMVYSGSPQGLATHAGWQVFASGTVLASAGDVNRDFGADLLLGDPESSQGGISLYLGSPVLLAPVGLVQRAAAGMPAIEADGLVIGTSFVAEGVVEGKAGSGLRLEVEARNIGTGTVVTAISAAAVSPGSTASATIELGGYGRIDWRARTVNALDQKTPWVEFGHGPVDVQLRAVNLAPTAGSIGQFDATGRSIPPGGRLFGSVLRIRAVLEDAEGDAGWMDVELRPEGVAYSGTPTVSTPRQPSGSAVDIPLSLSAGRYRWRCRGVDRHGAVGAWTEFGGNGGSAADIELVEAGSDGTSTCLQSARASRATILLAAAVAFLFSIRRSR